MTDRAIDTIRAFAALLPPHKASLTISHNEHRDIYMTVAEYLETHQAHDDEVVDRDALVAGDELWSVQVYPETPIGSYVAYGPTLEAVVLKVMEAK